MFFNNYSKPGPGVSKDEPKKKGLALYFHILVQKFFKLIELNASYFVVSLPFIVIIALLWTPRYMDIFIPNMAALKEVKLLYVVAYVMFTGILFNFYGSGPAAASYAYISRQFARGEHTWIFSDGFDKFKENFKQSMQIVFIDIISVFVIGVSLKYYLSQNSLVSIILFCILFGVYGLYTMAHIFIYQIMITYHCKVSDIIKYSIIFTVRTLPFCLLILLATGLICVLIYVLSGYLSILVYATVGMSLTKFPLELYAAKVLENNIEHTK